MVQKLLIILILASTAHAATWYCDPVDGSTVSGDGSPDHPWGTLQSVFAANKIQRRTVEGGPITNPPLPVAQGDTLKLRTGYHGYIDYSGWWNTDGAITIEADDGETPTMAYWGMSACSYWILRGLTFRSDLGTGAGTAVVTFSESGSSYPHHITVEDCDISCATDATVASWTTGQWASETINGINSRAADANLADNTIHNVSYGIQAGGNRTIVQRNTIHRFAGDGMRWWGGSGGGDDMIWQYNVITDSLSVDTNHDDGFQIYSGGLTVTGLTIRGNMILSPNDVSIPYTSSCQGIFSGGTDIVGWQVINNLIVTNHTEGIALETPKNTMVANNTLVRVPGMSNDPHIRWLDLFGTGNDMSNCVFRNNITGTISSPTTGLAVDHNITWYYDGYDYTDIFTDYLNKDMTLKAGCAAIDAGSTDGTPTIDVRGYARDASPDLGCYEYDATAPPEEPNEPNPEPVTPRYLLWSLP